MEVADSPLGFERGENDGGWLCGLLRSIEVVSQEETGQKCPVMPRFGKGLPREKIAQDKLSLEMRDALIAHHKVHLAADMLAESCRVRVKVGSTNALRGMIL